MARCVLSNIAARATGSSPASNASDRSHRAGRLPPAKGQDTRGPTLRRVGPLRVPRPLSQTPHNKHYVNLSSFPGLIGTAPPPTTDLASQHLSPVNASERFAAARGCPPRTARRHSPDLAG